MPELPEVETVRRALEPHVAGRRIRRAEFYERRVLRGDPEETAARLHGQRIRAVGRRAKHLLVELESGLVLAVHLGMTGVLAWGGRRGPHTRALLVLDRGRVVFDDPRMFGRIELCEVLPERIARLGPEPLEIAAADFVRRLRARRGAVKPLLLNQAFLGGLGNIYADEALFRAGIHPKALASRISPVRALRLFQAIRRILRAAIASGGTTVSDYLDAEGRPGSFQFQLRAYGRTGEPCPRCHAPIRRIVIGQRSTHFCARCQRR
ncbi:MAG: bifunctional DNA-formamidopyrimidine glycosylase/DNA-(apurinic or apyrimidinic site) lyase [Acidobacteria bacterium]|nr:bifunctional DNA-formamidopyrimidine glycosylase/DNA-(apurinic or apyrimidinic site) lyase [Acidobacteriota bacterium]